MNWKKKWKDWLKWKGPYWLRGGIIGILIGAILLLIWQYNLIRGTFTHYAFWIAIRVISNSGIKGIFLFEMTFLIFSLIQYFIIGAIIGFFFGFLIKNKPHRKEKTQS
jgi:nicotinamide riboside transporter PnuC